MEEESGEILGARIAFSRFVEDLVRFMSVHQNGSLSISINDLVGGCLNVTLATGVSP